MYLFSHDHELHEGVGPLFNGQACASCHNAPIAGGMGTDPTTFVVCALPSALVVSSWTCRAGR